MAKIAPSSIKYIIYANFEAEGAIEKPDVIGALFGQTEGLLGEDMEMRELQKTGKIGRIEVSTSYENGKTIVPINELHFIPSPGNIMVSAAESVSGGKDMLLNKYLQKAESIQKPHTSGGSDHRKCCIYRFQSHKQAH